MLKKFLILASFLCFSVVAQDTTGGMGGPFPDGDGAANDYSAPNGAYIGAGIGYLWNLDADNPTYQAFLGRLWGLGDYFALNANAEGATDFDDSWFVAANLGINFYPLPAYTAISPYIGVGAGLGWATATNLDADRLGLNFKGTIGLHILKNLPVGLMLEANVDWLNKDIVNENNPVILTGRLGIFF